LDRRIVVGDLVVEDSGVAIDELGVAAHQQRGDDA
jgi:hypothetical protein